MNKTKKNAIDLFTHEEKDIIKILIENNMKAIEQDRKLGILCNQASDGINNYFKIANSILNKIDQEDTHMFYCPKCNSLTCLVTTDNLK